MRRQLNIKKALVTILALCLILAINHCRQAQRTRRIQKTLPLAKLRKSSKTGDESRFLLYILLAGVACRHNDCCSQKKEDVWQTIVLSTVLPVF